MHFLSHLVDSLVLVASKCVRSSATYHIFLLTYSVRRKKHYYVLVKYKKSRLKRSAHHRKDKRDFSKSRRIHLRFRFDHLNYLHGTFLWNKAQLEESCLFFSYSEQQKIYSIQICKAENRLSYQRIPLKKIGVKILTPFQVACTYNCTDSFLKTHDPMQSNLQ